jgi:aldehyde:ferredoxin oxidoreductase
LDGAAAGLGVMPHWNQMVRNYYHHMSWDDNGEPLPETLESLGHEDIITQLDNREGI